jgi:hypothetical protein
MHDYSLPWYDRFALFLLRRDVRRVAAWIVAVLGAAIGLHYAMFEAMAEPTRADGNWGHANIDFAGQWVMGRMIVEGHGHRLYHRPTLRKVLEENYPISDQSPDTDTDDADRLMGWMIAGDGETTPYTLGGPLYPPVHALLYAPLALLKPIWAYRVVQIVNLLLTFFLGWLAERFSDGRVWWPVASLLLMLFPGYAGSINLGQNAVPSLALLTVGWILAARGREVTGGAVWGLLAFKPVWAVSFFLVPLLTRRWRMALAMATTGAVLAVATLPVVGWQTWLDWLAVGRIASARYGVSGTWLVLSRDLQNVPRRWFLDDPADPWGTRLGLGLWTAVVMTTGVVALLRRRTVEAIDGVGAAFVLLGAWMSCWHFMYYDVQLAALPILLFFTPQWSFRTPRRWVHRSLPLGPQEDGIKHEGMFTARQTPIETSAWGNVEEVTAVRRRVAPLVELIVPAVVLVFLIVSHYVASWLDKSFRFPPFDTLGLLGLWGWCGWRCLRRPMSADERPAGADRSPMRVIPDTAAY